MAEPGPPSAVRSHPVPETVKREEDDLFQKLQQQAKARAARHPLARPVGESPPRKKNRVEPVLDGVKKHLGAEFDSAGLFVGACCFAALCTLLCSRMLHIFFLR